METEISDNLVYLTENITNLQLVFIHCLQEKIITTDDRERIMKETTNLDKAFQFFDLLRKKDWKTIKNVIVVIFRKTSNEHCANKIEGVETPPNEAKKTSTHKQLRDLNTNDQKPKTILDSKWWPGEKYLPKAFLERKKAQHRLIDILKDNLTKSKNRSTVMNQGTVVSGMGGVGKTTIAKWFAIDFQDEYSYIIWLDSGEENLTTSFIELAKDLKVDATLRINLLSKKCFSKLRKVKCLFIFDNAKCYQGRQGIRDVLPKHENFDIIITSRTRHWGSELGDGKIPEMHLTAFPVQESVAFLKKNLEDKHYKKDQLTELSALLGNLPLALQIAVTTINTNILSLDEYTERIKQTDHIINQNFDDYEETINKTMKISLSIIENHESDPKRIAHKILSILGYIKSDFVDFKFLQSVERFSQFETEEAMELLKKYCLITTKSKRYCSIHRLLQQVIRHNYRVEEEIILSKILSVEGFMDYKLLPYLYAKKETQILFPEVRAQLIDQSRLVKLIEQRRFIEAVELSRNIKDTLKTHLAGFNYAICLEKIDKWEEAVSVLNEVHNCLHSEANPCGEMEEYLSFNDQFQRLSHGMDRNIIENGFWNLVVEITPELVNGLLFSLYSRLRLIDSAEEIVNKHGQLIVYKSTRYLDYVMKLLKKSSIGNYILVNDETFIFLNIRKYYEKKISLKRCSLSEEIPDDLHHLCLEDVQMLIGEEGHPLEQGRI